MGPGEVFSLLIVVLIPTAFLAYTFRRFFAWKEKQLETEANFAAEKAAQYASRSMELEQRVRVLEEIVTDGGAQTAAQIEALRKQPQIARPEKASNNDAVT
ncbi:MAG: hypothetical protein ABI770_08120 [Sphingomicrobium sp.]